MWIVVVVEHYYPSVLHFDDEELANQAYEKYKSEGAVTHIAEVKSTSLNVDRMKDWNVEEDDIKTWDVEWYLSI